MSLTLKAFERILRNEILIKTKDKDERLQYAYWTWKEEEDPIIDLPNFIVKHLEGHQNYVWLAW